MCEVLRCAQPVSKVIELPAPEGAPLFQAGVCTDHGARIDAGEKWVWIEDERGRGQILMGTDLDAGGAVVLGDWTYTEQLGLQELTIERTTPSGAPLEPLRIWISREELVEFIRGFKYLAHEAFQPPPDAP